MASRLQGGVRSVHAQDSAVDLSNFALPRPVPRRCASRSEGHVMDPPRQSRAHGPLCLEHGAHKGTL
eukprot:scaffold1042_cov401-Prasinococcus_capsulatus_cf.AAC.40